MLIPGVEPDLTAYKTDVRTDTLYEHLSGPGRNRTVGPQVNSLVL